MCRCYIADTRRDSDGERSPIRLCDSPWRDSYSMRTVRTTGHRAVFAHDKLLEHAVVAEIHREGCRTHVKQKYYHVR